MVIYHQDLSMRTVKIGVTLDQDLLARLDQLVKENQFPNRSRAVQEAIRDKLQRLERSRLARESAKLDPAFKQALADEGLTEDYERWPEY
jgi:Arc/MetJ-type ribon-helix-helix transcriptional regulator